MIEIFTGKDTLPIPALEQALTFALQHLVEHKELTIVALSHDILYGGVEGCIASVVLVLRMKG